MKHNKKAQTLGKKIEAGAIIIIIVVVLFLIYAEMVPEAQTAGDKLNASNRCEAVGCFYNTTTSANSSFEGDCANNASDSRLACEDPLGSGVPLGGLFKSSGIVFLIIMVGLLIIILKQVLPKGKK